MGVAYQLHHCMKQQGWLVGHHGEQRIFFPLCGQVHWPACMVNHCHQFRLCLQKGTTVPHTFIFGEASESCKNAIDNNSTAFTKNAPQVQGYERKRGLSPGELLNI